MHDSKSFNITATTGNRYNRSTLMDVDITSDNIFKDAAKYICENLMNTQCSVLITPNDGYGSLKFDVVNNRGRNFVKYGFVCDGDFNSFIDYNIDPKYLTCLDEASGDYKYYTLIIDKTTNSVHCDYGRMGQEKGTFDYMSGEAKDGSYDYPIQMYWIKYFEKIQKGYVDRSELKEFDNLTKTKTQASAKGGDYAPIPTEDEEVSARVLNYLISLQKNYVADNYDLSIPSSRKAIEKANQLLEDIGAKLEDLTPNSSPVRRNRVISSIKPLYTELVQIIPRKITNVGLYINRFSGSNYGDILQEERDLLQNFTEVYNREHGTEAEKAEQLEKDKKTILEVFNLSSTLPTYKERWEIEDRLSSKNGDGQIEDERHLASAILKVDNAPLREKFNACCKELNIQEKDKHLFFHGSRSANFWSIFSTGLKIFPNATNGRMYGNGIYFAPLARKSLGYTDFRGSYWSHGSQKLGYLMLFNVAMGRDVNPDNWSRGRLSYNDLHTAGYDSCWARAGSYGYLRNEECIVYREDQCCPEYLIEMDADRHTFNKFDISKIRTMLCTNPRYDIQSDTITFDCDINNYVRGANTGTLTYDCEKDTVTGVSGVNLDKQELDYITDVCKSNFAESPVAFKHWCRDVREGNIDLTPKEEPKKRTRRTTKTKE